MFPPETETLKFRVLPSAFQMSVEKQNPLNVILLCVFLFLLAEINASSLRSTSPSPSLTQSKPVQTSSPYFFIHPPLYTLHLCGVLRQAGRSSSKVKPPPPPLSLSQFASAPPSTCPSPPSPPPLPPPPVPSSHSTSAPRVGPVQSVG